MVRELNKILKNRSVGYFLEKYEKLVRQKKADRNTDELPNAQPKI